MQTIICALLIWFGSQVMQTTVELVELRTEVLHLRKDLNSNKTAQDYIHRDFENRLRELERSYAEEKS
jgi:hypothetical protein